MDAAWDSPTSTNINDAIRSEIESALVSEDTHISDIWQRTKSGQTPDEIRIAYGNERPNFVWNYLRTGKAIIEGDLPTAPTVALGAMRTLRRFLKDHEFSEDTHRVLMQRLAILESRAYDPKARSDEERGALEATAEAEAKGIPGVYVYTLPHYIRHPYDEESGRTLFKVGHTNRDMIRRFREQTRTTALPEDPVLLRVYECTDGDALEKERSFHRLLEAADHDRSAARTGGTEWFLTSTKISRRGRAGPGHVGRGRIEYGRRGLASRRVNRVESHGTLTAASTAALDPLLP